MVTYLVVLFVFLLFSLALAIGVLWRGRTISGSCGGLNTAMRNEDGECLSCGMKVDKKTQARLGKALEK